jgi:hypothetical protein
MLLPLERRIALRRRLIFLLAELRVDDSDALRRIKATVGPDFELFTGRTIDELWRRLRSPLEVVRFADVYLIGGTPTAAYPECVQLVGSACSAVAISPKHVLTSLHCVGNGVKVLPPPLNGQPSTPLSATVVGFDQNRQVALYEVAGILAAFFKNVAAKCQLVGRTGIAVGFGASASASFGVKQMAPMSIDDAPDDVYCTMGCSIKTGGIASVCWGDSGCPLLVTTTNGELSVAGIAQENSGMCTQPCEFTRIDSLLIAMINQWTNGVANLTTQCPP